MRFRTALGGKLECRLYGADDLTDKEMGLRPESPHFHKDIKRIVAEISGKLVAQRLEMGTNVLALDTALPTGLEYAGDSELLRPNEIADTIILPAHYSTLVMIGDSNQASGFAPHDGSDMLISMHCGLRTAYRPGEPLNTAVRYLMNTLVSRRVNLKEVEFYFGDGVQPTSYTFSTLDPKYGEGNQAQRDEVVNLYGQEAVVIIDEHTFGFDVPRIIAIQLIEAGKRYPEFASHVGLDPANIEIDRFDPKTHMDADGNYPYYSQTRANDPRFETPEGVRANARNASVRTFVG